MISLLFLVSAAILFFSVFGSNELEEPIISQIAKIDHEIENAEDSDYCPKPPTCYPQRCLVNQFPGCDCPPGYVLVITTNPAGNNYAYCQLTCLNSHILGCNGSANDVPQCFGPTISLSNCSLAALGSQFCQGANNTSCGNLYIVNGSYYCIAPDTTVTGQPSNPCGCGFGSQCSIISNVTCAAYTPTDQALQPLQSLSCNVCCPPQPQPNCCNNRYW